MAVLRAPLVLLALCFGGGTRSMVVFIGDSTMHDQYQLAKRRSMYHNLAFVHSSGWPSSRLRLPINCRFAALEDVAEAGDIELLYANFGSAHMLHAHPEHPWWFLPSGECGEHTTARDIGGTVGWGPGQYGWVADYAAYLHLESFVRGELRAYAKLARQVVVALPNYGCDEYTSEARPRAGGGGAARLRRVYRGPRPRRLAGAAAEPRCDVVVPRRPALGQRDARPRGANPRGGGLRGRLGALCRGDAHHAQCVQQNHGRAQLQPVRGVAAACGAARCRG